MAFAVLSVDGVFSGMNSEMADALAVYPGGMFIRFELSEKGVTDRLEGPSCIGYRHVEGSVLCVGDDHYAVIVMLTSSVPEALINARNLTKRVGSHKRV